MLLNEAEEVTSEKEDLSQVEKLTTAEDMKSWCLNRGRDLILIITISDYWYKLMSKRKNRNTKLLLLRCFVIKK